MPDPFGRNGGMGGNEQLVAKSFKCPSCASNLFFAPEVQGMVCRNCGNIYKPTTLEKLGSIGCSIEHDYTGDNEISEDDRKRHEIVCDSCGAALIADENTMSTMCPFCGSPALITRRMTREFKPDYIVPFKIDKKTAESNIKKWLQTRKMTPRGFKTRSRLTKIMPLYVPSWLVDCAVNTDLYGTGKINTWDTPENHPLMAKAKYYVKNVPFDASLNIANKLMEAIEPYDYSEMVKFDNKFLQGFCADKYDQGPFELMERFAKRMDRISMDLNSSIAAKFDSYDPEPQKTFSWMSEFSVKYCLLPVWFMTVEFEGRTYQFAVNGQTGEASGQAPTSSSLNVLDRAVSIMSGYWRWILFGASILLPLTAMLIAASGNMHPFFYFLVITLCAIELLIIISIILLATIRPLAERASNKLHEKIDNVNDFDKAPGMEAYLDKTRRVELKVLERRAGVYDKEDPDNEKDDKDEITLPFELY